MSVATDFAPSIPIPIRTRPRLVDASRLAVAVEPLELPTVRPLSAGASAAVRVLRPPADAGRAPLRLTRRGVAVLAFVVAAVCVALVWAAAASSSTRAAGVATPAGPAVVTVAPGDTLWSIASRSVPVGDPRAAVARLQQLNHLDGAAIVPGQQLRVR